MGLAGEFGLGQSPRVPQFTQPGGEQTHDFGLVNPSFSLGHGAQSPLLVSPERETGNMPNGRS